MTKTELESKIKELEASKETYNSLQTKNMQELAELRNAIDDLNKPTITKDTVTLIENAVEEALKHVSFDDIENYSYDFEINYDNRIELSNIGFDGADEVAEAVVDYVQDIFNIID